jgi:hypothetical protein
LFNQGDFYQSGTTGMVYFEQVAFDRINLELPISAKGLSLFHQEKLTS